MLVAIRRTALAIAGVAALAAAGPARADRGCDREPVFTGDAPPVWQPQEDQPDYYQPQDQRPAYPPPAWQPPVSQPPLARLQFSAALPPPPAWVPIAPLSVPAYRAWGRNELLREYRWLELARARFYRFGAWNPWRVRQFEAWYQARHAELDRRWAALAWAPGPRHGWRGEGWSGRSGEGWERGRWIREREDD